MLPPLPPLPPQPPRRGWEDGMPPVPMERNEVTPLRKLMVSGTCLAGGLVVQMGTANQPDIGHQLAYAMGSLSVLMGAAASLWYAVEGAVDYAVQRKWEGILDRMKMGRDGGM